MIYIYICIYTYVYIYCTEVIYYSLKLFIAHNPLKHVFLVPVISRDHPSSGHNHDTHLLLQFTGGVTQQYYCYLQSFWWDIWCSHPWKCWGIPFFKAYIVYPLAMTNSLPWKDPPILSLRKPSISIRAIYTMAMLAIIRGYILLL